MVAYTGTLVDDPVALDTYNQNQEVTASPLDFSNLDPVPGVQAESPTPPGDDVTIGRPGGPVSDKVFDFIKDKATSPSTVLSIIDMANKYGLGSKALSTLMPYISALLTLGMPLYDAIQSAMNTQEIEPGWGGLFGEKGDPTRTKDPELTDKMLAWENPNWGKPSAPSWGNMGPPGKDPGPWGPLGDAHFANLPGAPPPGTHPFAGWGPSGWGKPGGPGPLGPDPNEDAAPGEGSEGGDDYGGAMEGWGGGAGEGSGYDALASGGLVGMQEGGLASLYPKRNRGYSLRPGQESGILRQ